MNPRYLAYCKAHGKTPDEMVAHDLPKYSTGIFFDFPLWIEGKWYEWRKANNKVGVALRQQDHADFDKWLAV